MAISYKDIRNERQWRASTGLTSSQFEKLLIPFSQTYEELFGETIEERQDPASTFKTYSELLFFGLYSLKSGLTFDLLSISFGLSAPNVYQRQSLFLRIMESTLLKTENLPPRVFESEETFKTYLSEHPSIIIDVTEQLTQRPDNQEVQKENYSGKKNPTQ